jgi:hypothetical protein
MVPLRALGHSAIPLARLEVGTKDFSYVFECLSKALFSSKNLLILGTCLVLEIF